MNRAIFTALAMALAGATASPAASQGVVRQPAPAITSGIDTTAANAFVWRGFVVCDGLVVQPSVWVAAGPLTVSSWLNVARRGPNGEAVTEHDFTVDFTRPIGAWEASAGWIHYAFLDLDEKRYSNELYVGLARPGPLNPSARLYHDPHQGSGSYLSLGLSQDVATPWPLLTVTAALAAGYNHRLWTDYSAWSDASLVVTATLPGGFDRLSLKPFIGYSVSLDSRITTNRLLWGLGVGLSMR
jgi:hypothetical protein